MISAWRADKIQWSLFQFQSSNTYFSFLFTMKFINEDVHIEVWSSNAFFSMVMFIGLQFFKYKGKILLIFLFWCIIIYRLNIIYLLCLEFYVRGSLIFFFSWLKKQRRQRRLNVSYLLCDTCASQIMPGNLCSLIFSPSSWLEKWKILFHVMNT